VTDTLTRPTAGARSRSGTTTGGQVGLLRSGLIAGPLFLFVAFIQMPLRPGFDLARHPISALSLGDGGWIQVATFVVSGLLTIAFAIGVRRALHPGRAGTWGAILIAVFGAGLIGAGVFLTDPAFGFPAGTPDGMPATFTWHAMAHGLSFMVAMGSLVGATFVFARRFVGRGQRLWAGYSVATGIVALALAAGPPGEGASVRYAVASVVTWAWVFALAAQMLSERRSATN
jgi:hypothetical protein